MSNELKQTLQQKTDYKNFSEEIDIISESPAGTNVSLYTIKNKNGVTFQNVPGMPFRRGRAKMGYIDGDRSRPMLLGSSDISDAMRSGSARFGPGDIAPGATRTPSNAASALWPNADITAIKKWDIQLEVTSGPSCTGTTTKTAVVEAW